MIDFEEIRSRHGPLVWNTVYRVLRDYADSLDCYQDVFCEVLERHSRAEAEKGTGPICRNGPPGASHKLDPSPFPPPFPPSSSPPERQEVENWPGYLRWLATRRAIDRLRTRRRRQDRLDGGDVALVRSADPEPSESAQLGELAERVRHELTKLPERQAEAFWLSCIEDVSYEEIGKQLGADTSTVGVLIHRAKLRLRKMLTALEVGSPKAGGHCHD
jgi:RNA polymerase sigma factor (sigma-70 family)